MFHFQVGTNLPDYLHGLEKDGGRKQPFVLLLGDKLSPSQVFVIIERTALLQNSVLSAVDACFKAFQILNFEYPPACKPVWEFIQHGCFQLPGCGSITALTRSLCSAISLD